MQPDNAPEQEVPHIDGKETFPQPVKPDMDKIQEGQKRLEAAAVNLLHELDDLAKGNPDVDLSEESRQMDMMMAKTAGLAETVGQDSGNISKKEKQEVTDSSELHHMQGVKRWYKEQLGVYEIIPIDEDGNNLGY